MKQLFKAAVLIGALLGFGLSAPLQAASDGKKQAPAFATVRDRAQKLVGTVRVPVMPTSYVIGRDGVILAILTGYHGEGSDRALRAALDQALAHK